MLKKTVLFLSLMLMSASLAIMVISMMEANRKENMAHQVVAICVEGYAAASFLHGGAWSFAQVFERGANGKLAPVRCGKGPFGDSHWK